MWARNNPVEYMKLGVMRVYQTFFAGTNDIQQWTMNGYRDDLALYQRNSRLFNAVFNTITYILNAAGFIFIGISFVFFIKRFFSLTAVSDSLTGIILINVSFFVLLAFVYGGEARYAFPVFLFMIPAFVRLINCCV